MRSSLFIGRFGSLSVSLNYTWLFVSLLGLWGLALLWLPQNFPGWSSALSWLVAVLVMLLYLASMIARELVRAAVAGFDRRGVTLYPFGAASPYRLTEIGSGRILASMLAALLFNLLFGALLLFVADAFGGATGIIDVPGPAGFARAVMIPLAWLNLWAGIINLIPGIPFDGGRVLTNTLFWFSGQREQGLGLTRMVGEATSLGVVLLGAWIGLTAQESVIALTLVVLGWGAREAEEKGKQLSILRTGLSEISAGDVMDEARPQDRIPAGATVAQMVYGHPYYASDRPLPVVQREESAEGQKADVVEKLVGVVTLSKADDLLQGDWPSTPVTSLMSSPLETTSFAPETPIARVIELMENTGTSPEEQPAVPVIAEGKLLGSIDPARLAAFEQAEFELGATEASLSNSGEQGIFARLKGLLPALAVVAVLAIMGNIAISADPYSVRNLSRAAASTPVSFTDTLPLPGALVTDEVITVRAVAISMQEITTASLTLDGNLVPVDLLGPDPTRRIVTAQIPNPGDGLHTLVMVATDLTGRLGRTQWQFWVGAVGTPTPAPGVDTLNIVQRSPIPGGLLLAGSAQEARISLLLSWEQPVSEVKLFIDGVETPSSVAPFTNESDLYSVVASVIGLTAESHTVRVEVTGVAGDMYATDWTFFAILPDEEHIYFEATGIFVAPDFYSFWEEYGGLDIFGYPISDRIHVTDPDTGEIYTAQYFERARLELHPSLGSTILLGSLGVEVFSPEPPTTGKLDATFFAETGHNLSGRFLQFWEERGGLAVFGYPISEERQDTNPQDGKEYLVQYFERARFELHPEFSGTPYEVQLAQLGTLIYESK